MDGSPLPQLATPTSDSNNALLIMQFSSFHPQFLGILSGARPIDSDLDSIFNSIYESIHPIQDTQINLSDTYPPSDQYHTSIEYHDFASYDQYHKHTAYHHYMQCIPYTQWSEQCIANLFHPNPILWAQYQHLISKQWFNVGVINLHQTFNSHTVHSILCGINTAKYITPHDYYDQGSFSIKFPNRILETYFKINTTSHPNTIAIIPPRTILSILSHLYITKQLSTLTVYYLTQVMTLASFCEIASGITSPHFEIIVPLSLYNSNHTPSPALFSALFTMVTSIYNDLLVILQPIYRLLLNEPILDIITLNHYILPFAQPSPHHSSPLNIAKVGMEFAETIKPKSILINTILEDGQVNVLRVTNGLK